MHGRAAGLLQRNIEQVHDGDDHIDKDHHGNAMMIMIRKDFDEAKIPRVKLVSQ